MMLVSVPKSSTEEFQSSIQNLGEGMSTSCYVTNDPNTVAATPTVGCKFFFMFFTL